MNLTRKTIFKPEIVISSTPTQTDTKSTSDLLRQAVNKGILDIEPAIERSGINYPVLKELLGKDFSSTKFVLDSLLKSGSLIEKSQERMLICPQCSSPEVHSKFSCPRCNSDMVALTQLIEHINCGYIGPRADFVIEDSLVCPRCNTNLNAQTTTYRSIGNYFHCENCENRFDKPEVIHVCQNCGKLSTFREIKYIRVSTYRISDDVISKYMSELPSLESLRLYLSSRGYAVKLHSEIKGLSGMMSHFDLIAEKNNVRIVIDTSLQGNKCDIISFLAKKIDVNPTKALFMDLSGGTELSALGKIYGIDVWIVKDRTVPKELQSIIDNLDSSSVS